MADVPSVLNTQKYEEQKLTIRYFTNRIGLRICSYYWPTTPSAGNPKAVVVLIHGHGGYLPFEFLKPPSQPGKPRTYAGSWVETLNEAGYSVCGIDMEGMGRSEGVDGLRLYWNAFDDIVDDVLQLTRGLQDCDLPGFRGLPVFLLGQSLGGGVAAATMQRAPDLYRGAVLLCPMLSLEKLAQKPMNRILRPIVGLLNMTVPWLPAATPQRNEDCPEVQRDYDEDPGCYHGSVRVRVAKEYVDACARMMKALPDITWPFLVFQSRNDQSVDPEGAEQLMAQAASTDKEIQWVNDMQHVLTKEAGNERILAQILPWLAARC